jgi:hypothetical protein
MAGGDQAQLTVPVQGGGVMMIASDPSAVAEVGVRVRVDALLLVVVVADQVATEHDGFLLMGVPVVLAQ